MAKKRIPPTNERHGDSWPPTPEYKAWQSMKDRCTNPHNKWWHRYGGRGIMVTPAWRDSFTAFLADVGRRPSRKHSFDRINNDGDYAPDNVRWATGIQQHRNKRSNHPLTLDGVTMLFTQWAVRLGMPKTTLSTRLSRGWSIRKALTHPVKTKARRKAR